MRILSCCATFALNRLYHIGTDFMTKKKLVNILFQVVILTLLSSCNSRTSDKMESKKAILLADREAPLGWIYLRIYEDSTFEFESRGLERQGTIYPGTIDLIGDTIVFHYRDSIPIAGDKAI